MGAASSVPVALGRLARRSVPLSRPLAALTSCVSRSRQRRASLACRIAAAPASVGVTPSRLRTKSAVRSSRSSALMARLTAGWAL
jgi:hypothetical protein